MIKDMRVKITGVDLMEIDPESSGKLAKERAEKINQKIREYQTIFQEGQELEITGIPSTFGGRISLMNCGIYYIPYNSIPRTVNIFFNLKTGEIESGKATISRDSARFEIVS